MTTHAKIGTQSVSPKRVSYRPISTYLHGLVQSTDKLCDRAAVCVQFITVRDRCTQCLLDLRRLQNMTTRDLAAKELFQSDCSVEGTKKLEGELKV